jgi:hypothetical protein
VKPSDTFPAEIRRVQQWALLVGLVASLLAALGWYFSPVAFFSCYLIAFLFWLGISLGCLAVAMIHHLTGGGWGMAIRRICEGGYSALPLLAVLFLPLLAGLPVLYPWARPEVIEHDPLLQAKQGYLNPQGFLLRAVVYFVIWIGTGLVLNAMSAGSDPTTEYPRRRRLALWSGPGLVLWCLTVTFAAVDWSMSLEPHWFSSMYGVLFMAGDGVSGLATAIITLVLLRAWRPVQATYDVSRQHDLGNFLLAFVLFWSYVSFSQYLIIWSGNLPEETPWYLNRARGGWQAIAIAIMALHFLVPFLLLLMRQAKRTPNWLLGIAVLLLVMRWVDLYWTVMPAFSPGVFTISWLHIVAFIAIGGWWLAMFTWRLAARLRLPVFDIPLEEDTLDDVAHQPAP